VNVTGSFTRVYGHPGSRDCRTRRLGKLDESDRGLPTVLERLYGHLAALQPLAKLMTDFVQQLER
jgi:hypothetical protein